MTTYLYHHGIIGQKWGVRNGPPYPLKGGQYYKTAAYFQKYRYENRANSESNKKHFDKYITKGTTLQTLSYDPNRTKKANYYYATYKKLDNAHYTGFFNARAKDTKKLKFRIKNRAKRNMKIASEDSGIRAFMRLYSTDRDFYNYVTDPRRMQSHFNVEYLGIKSLGNKHYTEARKALNKARSQKQLSYDDLAKIYRIYNYTIPSEGKDTSAQRMKFFRELRKNGYDAVLDTNDALYNTVKTNAPIIVINPRALIPEGAEETRTTEKIYGIMVSIGRKALRR